MIRYRRRALVAVCLFSVSFTAVRAAVADADGQLTLGAAIAATLAGNPELAINALDTRRAAAEADRIEGALDARATATVGISEDQTPVASDFLPDQTRFAGASGGITKPLTGGGELQAAIDYNRTQLQFASPLAAQLARINPAYRGAVSVLYRHPLARGADRPEYHDALSAAGADTLASRVDRHVIARHLALQTVTTWYQLLSSDVSIRLADIAVDRARRLLDYQKLRSEFGLIETADVRQAEALLASRALELQSALATRDQHQVALNRLMRRAPDTPLRAAPHDAPRRDVATLDDAFEAALRNRPEFQQLDARLDAAIARQRITRDTTRTRVDLIAELGSMTLDRNPGDAATDPFGLDHHFAGLSLELSETWRNRTADADYRLATLARERVLLERQRIAEQVRDDLAGTLTTLRTGVETLRLARLKVDAERHKFDAEMARYRDGRSDTASVIQFEGDLHDAELQAELLQLSLQLAGHQLAWSTGTLFADLDVTIPDTENAAP